MKPLPHEVCRNSLKPESTRCSLYVEQLSFLARRNPTVGSAENLERRHSLSKRKNHKMANASPFFLLRFLFLCFYSFLLLFFFFFSFLFSSPFIFFPFSPFSLHFSHLFWSIDRMGQKEEVFSPPSSCQMCGYPFSILFFIS